MNKTAELALGIDVGTGATKAVLADIDGKVLWHASSSYEYKRPKLDYAEQDPQDWWNAICKVTGHLFQEHPEARKRVTAVALSGQGVAAILLDGRGQVLRPAILWPDRRCAQDAEDLQIIHGEKIVSISGKLPASYNFEPKLRWIQRHEPAVWSRCWKAFTTTSLMTFRLTGCPVINHSDGGILLAYDLAARTWSSEVQGLLELPDEVYCDLVNCDTVVGRITDWAESETGIPRGVPVLAGGEDTSCAGLAMGAITSSTGQLSLGTANTVNVPMKRAVIHPKLLAFPHVVPDCTLIGGSLSSGGLAVRWLGKIFDGDGGDSGSVTSEQLTVQATAIPPGSDGLLFLPYLAGELQPVNDGFARGVFFGLTSETGRAHLLRAVLEGNAFAIEHNLSLARTVGAAPQELAAVGGPARNRLLCQIIADVTGLDIRVMEENGGAALGSAILAAHGTQMSSFSAMQKAHARVRELYRPNPEQQRAYRKVFERYLALGSRVKDLYPRPDREESALW